MREAMFQSKCPKCGNVDILTEKETKRIVHCQTCYNHYEYRDNNLFKGYTDDRFFNLD